MEKFTKYYSYNQFIESFDILVMSDQQYLTIKDQLDNPQRIVLVNRVGGPKEPKIPKWFEPYKQQFDSLSKQFDSLNQQFDSFRQQTEKRFEKIENRLNNIESKLDDTKMPEWFKQWTTTIYEKQPPKWFTTSMEEFARKNNLKL